MGNRITRTVLFAASALLAISAFGAGAARFGTLRNSDWVVTNAWQAVSNKTHDLILEIGDGDSLPPDWLNVSNAAMNAVQSLSSATNYTDTAISALSDTGIVFRAKSVGNAYYWQDATGTVWQVQDGYGEWSWTIDPAVAGAGFYIHWGSSVGDLDGWYFDGGVGEHGGAGYYLGGNSTSTNLTYTGDFGSTTNYTITFSRPVIHGGATNAVDRVLHASDNIAADLTPATNYTDAVAADIRQSYIPIDGGPIFSTVELFLNNLLHEQGMLLLELPSGGSVDAAAFVGSTQITNQGAVAVAEGLAARKQDALPYPTNAIPYAAIDGAPGGGTPEWRVVDVHSFDGDELCYVTNGMTRLFLGDYVMLSTNGWPEGAAMFVQAVKEYDMWYPASEMRLVGYGTWPTNDFQSVWWRSGTNIFVNILVEE